jgi:valyl-tRNA synthetase
MESKFTPQKYEKEIYQFWEESNLLKTKSDKPPYTILMPPPNANASLHAGHGMYTVDDIMIRYKRLRGYASLWIPGMDHAGFETQFVYEKYLTKQGKSRIDFDRQTLYNNIYQFVKENSGLIYQQFKKLGFLADWSRSIFTLDAQVIKKVFETFKKMESEGSVYRDNYIVNYCTHCGTSLAELEVEHEERVDPLYYIKYGPFSLATVRPETKFGDTAVAVYPKDKRYKKWIGREIEVEGLLGKFRLKVIADEMVDPKFGTGVVKVTPAHDPDDFKIGKRHGLEIKQVIDLNGRLNSLTGPYAGLKVKEARKKIVEDLEKKGLIDKIDRKYFHRVTVCYRCQRDLEPMIIPNWFIRVKELKQLAIRAIKENRPNFIPKKFKKQILQWLSIMHDWPISRQIIWGIRIPVWYKVERNAVNLWVRWLDKNKIAHQGNVSDFFKKGIKLLEIEKGLQKLSAVTGSSQPNYVVSLEKPGKDYLPETDTFDTWFSSGQWPLVVLKEDEFKTRFPTDMMGTLEDILKLWVSRMIMFSLYIKNKIPFKNVYLWSMVADSHGIKMSKSKGNVVNPIDMVDKYGADAFRSSLVFGTSQGGKVILSDDKVRGMRNFANKIWNIGRFIYLNSKFQIPNSKQTLNSKFKILNGLQKEFKEEKKKYLKNMDSYRFSQALGLVYEFLWHRFADYYVEQLKEKIINGNIEALKLLKKVYLENLKMIHPFMPFVTEAVWKVFKGEKSSILLERLKS